MAVTITRTPWIDDDGTGTTGTVLNNAIKTELYGQIDAALAQVPQTGARLTAPAFLTANGFTAVASGVPTLAFNIPGGGRQGILEVWTMLPGSGLSAWGAAARILWDGYASVVMTTNKTPYMEITTDGAAGVFLTVGQTHSGVAWGYTLLGV